MRPSKQLSLVCLLLALLISLSACSREVRYKTLTFFFTGVPPIDYKPPPPGSGQEMVSAAELSDLERYALAKRIAAAQFAQYSGDFGHGPFAGNYCDACHQTKVGGSFGFGGGKEDKVSVMPTDFQAPRELLCVGCHTSQGPTAIGAAGLRQHGPAKTDCTLCHHPHGGREQFFLFAPAAELCQKCHGEGFIHDTKLHTDAGPCLDCHNPHLGLDARMLRDEYIESF
ncbi:MAG: hypothetical protein K0A99_08470 [Desulfoarculaceae bacterium]|nr:hypothetical protein [Desulfoarculaceae bacterium]